MRVKFPRRLTDIGKRQVEVKKLLHGDGSNCKDEESEAQSYSGLTEGHTTGKEQSQNSKPDSSNSGTRVPHTMQLILHGKRIPVLSRWAVHTTTEESMKRPNWNTLMQME